MDSKKLMEQVLRSEGYAQGFRDGYMACAKYVAEEESKNGTKDNKNDTGQPETVSN